MKTELKNAWTKALRSGDYKQGMGRLCIMDNYCCIGVLTDVIDKQFPDILETDWEVRRNGYGEMLIVCDGIERSTRLPPELRNKIELNYGDQSNLIRMNDGAGCSFNEIADYIEENL